MHIFIDESGSFTINDTGSGRVAIDCVAAVVMTDECLIQWEASYSNLRKAKDLNKNEAKEIVAFLTTHGARAFVIDTDSSAYSQKDVIEHRANYINSMFNAVSGHPEYLIGGVEYHAKILSEFSEQQYVKTMLILALIENTIRGTLANTSEYLPADLEYFYWHCDEVTPATYPIIQYLINLVLNCNAYESPINTYNKKEILHFLDSTETYLNANKLLESFAFDSDDACHGIKAADCIANFFRGMLRSISSRRLENDSIENMVNLLSQPYGIDSLHFNKDLPFMESRLSHYGRFFTNKIMNKFEC